MSDVPVQVVVAAYRSQTAANDVLEQMKILQDAGKIKIDNAAVLDRDMNNQLHIRDTKDWGFGKGALAGGAVGVVLGLLAGPVGWAVLGSAVVGGVAAKMHHTYGFDEARLKKLGESLQPGSSAIVAVVEHLWVAQVEEAMKQQSTDIFVESISKDIAEQLAAGKDVGYSAVSTGDTLSAQRMAANETEAQYSSATYTPQGTYVEAADVAKDHVTYGAAVADDQGIAGVIIEATPEQAAGAENQIAGAADQAAGAAGQAAGAADQAAGTGSGTGTGAESGEAPKPSPDAPQSPPTS
jgi:uncharacterized membrane protein